MKKILSAFISIAFLSIFFTGSAFSETQVMDDTGPAISREELEEDEPIFDFLITPDSSEDTSLENMREDIYEEHLDKEDKPSHHESDMEDDKAQEVEEKEQIIF